MALKFTIKKDYFLLNVKEVGGNFNLYTLTTITGDKLEAIGTRQADLQLFNLHELEIELTIKNQQYEFKDGTKKWLNTAQVFIRSLKQKV